MGCGAADVQLAVQAKIAEAGGIAPLVLLLSTESPHLQAAAAQCLHNLANDAERRAVIVEAGAVPVLQDLLESKEGAGRSLAQAWFPLDRVCSLWHLSQVVKFKLGKGRGCALSISGKVASKNCIKERVQ